MLSGNVSFSGFVLTLLLLSYITNVQTHVRIFKKKLAKYLISTESFLAAVTLIAGPEHVIMAVRLWLVHST